MVPRHQDKKYCAVVDTRCEECVQLGSLGQHPRRSTRLLVPITAENNCQILLGKSARLHHGRRSRVLRSHSRSSTGVSTGPILWKTLCMTRSCASTSMAMFVSSVSRTPSQWWLSPSIMADRTRSKNAAILQVRGGAPGSQLTKRLTTRRRLCSSTSRKKSRKPSPSRPTVLGGTAARANDEPTLQQAEKISPRPSLHACDRRPGAECRPTRAGATYVAARHTTPLGPSLRDEGARLYGQPPSGLKRPEETLWNASKWQEEMGTGSKSAEDATPDPRAKNISSRSRGAKSGRRIRWPSDQRDGSRRGRDTEDAEEENGT
ncbi:unnamed protein product [Trichogramma brassicae]|uniref:Uncharacterized protein n=1 Tax=Trichogramma brassicae TaxID=86971 RepID=A0A6H5IBR5_9HYME|nr:unnamed protein product [Trichogramma brassicae]